MSGRSSNISALDRLRLERGVNHLHKLGPRATYELLAEVVSKIGGLPCVLATLDEYRQRLTPAMVGRAGGDRFPRRPLHLVERVRS
jgi:hypothetical protein